MLLCDIKVRLVVSLIMLSCAPSYNLLLSFAEFLQIRFHSPITLTILSLSLA
jgi:hypothetical protein